MQPFNYPKPGRLTASERYEFKNEEDRRVAESYMYHNSCTSAYRAKRAIAEMSDDTRAELLRTHPFHPATE